MASVDKEKKRGAVPDDQKVPKNVYVPTGKPRGRPPGKKVENRGAHLRKPEHLKVGRKEYVPTGKPRGRPPGSVKTDQQKTTEGKDG